VSQALRRWPPGWPLADANFTLAADATADSVVAP